MRRTARRALLALTLASAFAAPLAAQDRTLEDDARLASRGSLVATAAPLAGGLALALSGAPESGLALVIGAYVFGPAVGYVATGHYGRGLGGTLLRAGAMAGVAGIVGDCWAVDCPGAAAGVIALTAAGLVSVIYDLVTVDDYVRSHVLADATVSPYVDADRRVGLGIAIPAP